MPKGNATQQAYRYYWMSGVLTWQYKGLVPSSQIVKPHQAKATLISDRSAVAFVAAQHHQDMHAFVVDVNKGR